MISSEPRAQVMNIIIYTFATLITRRFPIPFIYLNTETHKNDQPQYLGGGIF